MFSKTFSYAKFYALIRLTTVFFLPPNSLKVTQGRTVC